MTAKDIDNLLDNLEKNLRRDFIISSSFRDIERGILNNKRRAAVVFINLLTFINAIRSLIGAVADSHSHLHYYSLNPLFGYGFIGRFMSGFYVCGYPGIICHSMVFFINEGKNTLTLVTDLRRMASKLSKKSPDEAKRFAFFLKLMLYVREIGLVSVTIPMALFRGIGAAVTAYKFRSLLFAVMYFPVFVLFVVAQQYIVQTYVYLHLLIAQSTAYFKLRFNKVNGLLLQIPLNPRLTKSSSHKERRINLSYKHLKSMNWALLNLEEILNEIRNHNECIKYWLRDGLLCMGGMFSLCLVFVFSDIEWYFRILPIVTFLFLAAVLGVSFSNASQLYVRIKETEKLLYSSQTVIQLQADVTELSHRIQVVKSKFQIMRMIHRMSSPSIKIGYTDGNGESFSPLTAASFLTTTIFVFLMFMNSKYSYLYK